VYFAILSLVHRIDPQNQSATEQGFVNIRPLSALGRFDFEVEEKSESDSGSQVWWP
jgi:hypothetical protein